jgi:hypothetical protein
MVRPYSSLLKHPAGSATGNASTRQGATNEKVETFDCGATAPCEREPAAPRRYLLQGMVRTRLTGCLTGTKPTCQPVSPLFSGSFAITWLKLMG